MQIKPINIIYLKIADFIIRIDFYPRRHKLRNFPSTNKLDEQIISVYKNFIEHKKPERIDFNIFLYNKHLILTNKNGSDKQKKFLYLYEEEEEEDLIKSFQHLSISHFMHIILYILQKLLSKNNGFILHGSANIVNDEVYIYSGPSRAGKSTTVSLLKSNYPIFSDDILIIRKLNETLFAFQTPFIEKNYLVNKTNKKFKVGKLFFLKKRNFFKIKKIEDKQKILMQLSKQLQTTETDKKSQLRYLMDFVVNTDEFYNLYFANQKKPLITLIENENRQH